MNGVTSILTLENETKKKSPMHLLDGRIKLVILIFIIVYASIFNPNFGYDGS